MQTTLTLEPDVERMLRDRVKGGVPSLEQVINDALRRGLQANASNPERRPFQVEAWDLGGLRPGLDPIKLNQLVDEVEVASYLEAKALRQSSAEGAS